LVIDEKPTHQKIWKVILGFKRNNLIDQEIFDSVFPGSLGIQSIEFILHRCDTGIIRSFHIEVLVPSTLLVSKKLEIILRIRGSLNGLITEEATMERQFCCVEFLVGKCGGPIVDIDEEGGRGYRAERRISNEDSWKISQKG
jgi:hypothetical protein